MLNAGSLVHTPVASDEQVAGDAMVVRPDRTPSWMAPDIKGQSLLYVTDFSGGEVFVYSYPQGKLVGQLTGLNEPNGACVDKTGDVWIADTGASKIVEYKHGGKWPIKPSTMREICRLAVPSIRMTAISPSQTNLRSSGSQATS
jgi:sugar lactone lactonase YvrE